MKYFRGSLTKIEKKIEANLPDIDDIYGYEGFNKSIFLKEIGLLRSLSREIEKCQKIGFEKSYLSRQLSHVNDVLNTTLEKTNPEYEFRKFIDSFSELVDKTKIAYFTARNDNYQFDIIRIDIENSIKNLKNIQNKYSDEIDDIREMNSEIIKTRDSIAEINDSISSMNEFIEENYKTIVENKNNFTEIYESVEGWNEEISESLSSSKTIKDEVNDLQAKSSLIASNVKINEEKSNDLLKILNKQKERHQQFIIQIEETLEDANRVGMAGSFKERKEETSKTQETWMKVFITSLVLLSGLSLLLFVVFPISSDFVISIDSIGKLLIRLAIISPIIWLAWFSSGQYSLINKIREDYSYKYASSMAYEGYKKAADECDAELALKLLDSSINNISQHPIRLFTKKNDYRSPMSETVDLIRTGMTQMKNFSVKIPGVNGKMKVEFYKDENIEDTDA